MIFLNHIGTPSADNPIPGINPTSSLLERLSASSSQGSQPASPMTSPSPTGNVNLQGVNLTSLPNSINGLQNVQVGYRHLYLNKPGNIAELSNLW